MKKMLICLAFLFGVFSGYAQKKQNVYFLKNNGKPVSTKDSADIVRIIQEPDSGEVHYNLIEYYANGKRKTLGKLSDFEPVLVFEGALVSYNSRGIKTKTMNYKGGVPLGAAFTFFENGMPKEQLEYLPFSPSPQTPFPVINPMNGTPPIPIATNYKLIYLADSLGNVSVKDGNGHVKRQTKMPDGDELLEEGDYKEGYKDGKWTGSFTSGKSAFNEVYEAGKLTAAESVVNGKSYPYKNEMESPQFKGGPSAWRSYLSSTMTYPREAAQMYLQGVVLMEFTIDKDGSISDINVLKSVGEPLDNEARRILARSPKWIPAKYKGIPVKVKQTQPFNFRLPTTN